MKIMVVMSMYPPFHIGGYEIECRDVVESLTSRGHDVTVVTSMHGVGSARIDGNVHRIMRLLTDEIDTGVYRNKLKRIFKYLITQWEIACISHYNASVVADVLDRIQPDVVYFWNLADLTLGPYLPVSKRGIPHVWRIASKWLTSRLEYYQKCGWIRGLIRRMLTGMYKSDYNNIANGLFLPPSMFVGKQLIEAGLPPDRVIPLSCKAHIPETIPPLAEGDTFRMLFVGRVCEDKGVHIAVAAAGELSKDAETSAFTLDIVGPVDESYIAHLENKIEELGIKDKIKIWGTIPQEQLANIRKEYHAMVFASMWGEPGAAVLIEAMADGLPVVASPDGGTAEYLVNEENSLTFPLGDYKAMAAAIKRLMKDRELMLKLRDGGRRTALDRFKYEKIMNLHEHYLSQVYESSKTSTSPHQK